MQNRKEIPVIDVDAVSSPPIVDRNSDVWVEGLSHYDKALLLDGGWLNDTLIDRVQELLKFEFPHIGGLQSVIL